MTTYMAKPYDVLFFRGNKSFDIGVWYSDGAFPPLPSTFQGFVRTALLMDKGLVSADGNLNDIDEAKDLVGDDQELAFDLEGPYVCDNDQLFVSTPLDLLRNGHKSYLPQLVNTESLTDLGFKLDALEIKDKPKWTREKISIMSKSTLIKYRQADSPFVLEEPPVAIEDHVGIQLDYRNESGRKKQAKEGMFYMTPYRRFAENAGLLFSTDCSEKLDGLSGKLGSEGRGANIKASSHKIDFKENDQFYEDLAEAKRFKLLLLQPGVFQTGWLPFPGNIESEQMILNYDELELKLLFARTGPSLRISGFSYREMKVGDKSGRGFGLKPMLNAVPAGAVYYFEILNPSEDVPEKLKSLDGSKVQNKPYCQMGFNQVILAKLQ